MKIALLSIHSGTSQRGMEVFVDQVATRLATNNEVIVYQGGPTKRQKYRTIQIPTDKQASNITKYAFGWRLYLDPASLVIKNFTHKALAQIDPTTDIVIPTNGGWQSLLTRIWTWRHGKKMVISGHSGIGWDDRINLLTRPDIFVALTNYQRAWAKQWAFGVRTETIPDGVDTDLFAPSIRPAKVDLPRPIIICVAALEKDKGIIETLKAVAALKTGSLLLLTGGGSAETEIRHLANDLLPDKHQILTVPHADMPAYYRAANLLAMTPKYSEAFGMVYLEAMATGLPVVASDDPIRREIIGDAGLFVDAGDTQAYATALETALAKNWEALPRKQAEKFSWAKITDRYQSLFTQLT